MKKEVAIAILIGVGIGLVFTYGIWLANQSLKQAGIKTSNISPISQITPTVPPPISQNFMLNTPEDNLLTNDKTITVSGLSDSAVVILTENSQYIIPASPSGTYSQKIILDTGYNRIKVINLKDQSSLSKLVTYSSTTSLFTNSVITPKISPSASPSNSLRDAVKDKVAQEIAQIKQNSSKKAYLDEYAKLSDKLTITAETVIKLKNNSEGTTKDLTPKDLILAMGDADAAGHLLAKRILVIDPPPADTRKVLSGTVTAFTNKTLTVNDTVLNISKDTLFQPSKYKFKDIDPGFKLIAVYTPTSTPLIYIVSEK